MNKTTINPATALKLLELPITQMGNAERMNALIGDDCKYVPELKRWFRWNGRFWEAQDESVMMLAIGNAARDLSQAIRLLPNAGDQMEMLHRQQVCDNLKKLERGTENKSVLDFMAGLAAVKFKDFDANPFLLNVQNGTLNLLTGELQPHSKTDYMTKICNASYEEKKKVETEALPRTEKDEAALEDSAASLSIPLPEGETNAITDSEETATSEDSAAEDCAADSESAGLSLWEQTVSTILPDPAIRKWMQKFIGYCLTGSTEEEKFVVAYGPGGTGKGTFFETIGAAIGEYKDVLPVDTLLTTNLYTGGQGPSPELAKLYGKRYVLSSESNRCRHLDEAKIKLLTGGDTITARHLCTEPISYSPTFKLILQTNFLPSVSDSMDEGIRRRLVIVPFNAKIERRDKKLKQKLLTEENRNACLAWCVEGAKLWRQEGLDDMPAALKEAASSFYQECDLLQQWLDERTEPSLGFLKFRTALKDFNDWLARCGNRPWQQKCFSEAMRLHGKEKLRRETGYCYSGLCLRYA